MLFHHKWFCSLVAKSRPKISTILYMTNICWATCVHLPPQFFDKNPRKLKDIQKQTIYVYRFHLRWISRNDILGENSDVIVIIIEKFSVCFFLMLFHLFSRFLFSEALFFSLNHINEKTRFFHMNNFYDALAILEDIYFPISNICYDWRSGEQFQLFGLAVFNNIFSSLT